MADDDEKDDDQEDDDGKKKGGFSTPAIIGIAAGFLILQVVVVAVVFMVFMGDEVSLFGDDKKEPKVRIEEADGDEPMERVVKRLGNIHKLKDDIIVNPSDSRTRFAVVSIAFEFRSFERKDAGQDTINPFTKDNARGAEIVVKDRITRTIASFGIEELQQVAIQDSIKEDLKRKLQPYFEEDKIINIYFERFIIQ